MTVLDISTGYLATITLENSEEILVNEILELKKLVKEDFDLKLLCSLNKNTKNIKKVIQKNNKCVKILLVVGPEGGFDPKEEEYLLNKTK